eukprot:1064429-Pyramimonas_sp.AAC.1
MFSLPHGCEILTARSLIANSRKIVMQDCVAYVLADGRVRFGCVWFHFSIGGACYSCISQWEMLEVTDTAVKCRTSDSPDVFLSSCIFEPCTFMPSDVGKICTIILPPKLNQRVRRSRA